MERLLDSRVLNSLEPRFLSTIVYATASAPASVRDEWASSAVGRVLPVLLQQDKLAGSNEQVGNRKSVCLGVGIKPDSGVSDCLEARLRLFCADSSCLS